jgi:chitinase
MATYDADGVDIDWEPLATADEPAFTSLLKALRAAAPNALLTLPIGGLNMNTVETVDPFFADVAPLVDQENVMSYGMSGAWEGWQSWHSSPIGGESPTTPESIESSVQAYLQAGMPAAKLGIGVGFYGLCYTLPVTGPVQALGASTIAASDGVMTYANIMGNYYTAAAAQWDPIALVPYLSFEVATGAEGCGFISYDDAQSVAAKAAYVKANGLGGTILWEIAEGYQADAPSGQENALMEAVRTSFLP